MMADNITQYVKFHHDQFQIRERLHGNLIYLNALLVPEAATTGLLAVGLVLLGTVRWRSARASSI